MWTTFYRTFLQIGDREKNLLTFGHLSTLNMISQFAQTQDKIYPRREHRWGW
jgi:hypothetical protein